MSDRGLDLGSLYRSVSRQRDFDNLKDFATAHIRRSVISGELPPRSKVDQDAIAEALGISRVPVREALIELAQKDFVVAIPRRGAFVGQLTVEDIEDHYEVVAMVFGLTTRRAAKRLTPADLDDLRRLHAQIESTSNETLREELDFGFLSGIARAGSSRRLNTILQFLGGALAGSFYRASPEWAAHESGFFASLLDALEVHDVRRAGRITEEHLRGCATVAIDVLRDRHYWGE